MNEEKVVGIIIGVVMILLLLWAVSSPRDEYPDGCTVVQDRTSYVEC